MDLFNWLKAFHLQFYFYILHNNPLLGQEDGIIQNKSNKAI